MERLPENGDLADKLEVLADIVRRAGVPCGVVAVVEFDTELESGAYSEYVGGPEALQKKAAGRVSHILEQY